MATGENDKQTAAVGDWDSLTLLSPKETTGVTGENTTVPWKRRVRGGGRMKRRGGGEFAGFAGVRARRFRSDSGFVWGVGPHSRSWYLVASVSSADLR